MWNSRKKTKLFDIFQQELINGILSPHPVEGGRRNEPVELGRGVVDNIALDCLEHSFWISYNFFIVPKAWLRQKILENKFHIVL